jgi:hypothetical protein
LRSHWGRTLIGLYYQHSPALNQLLAGHDSLKKAVAIGLVLPLTTFAYVTLYTSPAEKAVLFLLMAGGMAAGCRLVLRSVRAKKTEAGKFMDSPLRGNDKNTGPEAGRLIFY